MTNEHDTGYKFLFSRPELVRDLIAGFVPDDWLASLDYATLEKIPASYITEDFRQRADDVVWRVKVGGDWVYLYLLLEFQSRVDRYMALRIMVYVGLLYQDLIARDEIASDGRLPPVLPIVLYNGSAPWTACQDVAELIPPVPGLVERFKPHMRYLLIDENAYSEAQLKPLKNLVAAVFRIEHPASPAAVGNLIGLLDDWLVDRPDLKRMFAVWIRATLMRNRKYRIVLPEIDDLQEIKVMLSERVAQWAQEYKLEGQIKGRLEGRLEGEAAVLERQLVKRFGPLGDDTRARLNTATLDQLERWAERILDAPALAAVFEDH